MVANRPVLFVLRCFVLGRLVCVCACVVLLVLVILKFVFGVSMSTVLRAPIKLDVVVIEMTDFCDS